MYNIYTCTIASALCVYNPILYITSRVFRFISSYLYNSLCLFLLQKRPCYVLRHLYTFVCGYVLYIADTSNVHTRRIIRLYIPFYVSNLNYHTTNLAHFERTQNLFRIQPKCTCSPSGRSCYLYALELTNVVRGHGLVTLII